MLAFACLAIAILPDNRVYEMVSPIEKGGLSFLPNLAVSDAGGEHVIVDGGSKNALLSSGVSWMLETRTPTGWTGVQIGPAPTFGASTSEQTEISLNAVSDDFSSFAFQSRMALDPRDTTHGMGEYVRTGPSGRFTWPVGPPPPNVLVSEPEECNNGQEQNFAYCVTNRAVFAGASKNLQDVVWGEYRPLLVPPASLPGYPADTHEHGYEVYESANGIDQLTGLVPVGAESECGPSSTGCVVPPCGAAMGNQDARGPFGAGFAPLQGAVSGEGSQVVFTSPDPATYRASVPGCTQPEIYLREAGVATVQVSLSHKTGGDPNGPKEKIYAGSSEEGGRLNAVFFTSKEELTENANTGGSDEGVDLYAYTIPVGSLPGHLLDLTPLNNTPGPSGNAEVTFLGASRDDKLVYFTASSVLATEPNSQGQTAQPNARNLYVINETSGSTRFIASGNGLAAPHVGLSYGFSPTARRLTSELTPDGQHLVFVSAERLTKYNNFGPECNGGFGEGAHREPGQCSEVYIYTATTNSLVCVSCNPAGTPPAGSARLPENFTEGYSDGSLEPGTLLAPKAISDDGTRVFFSSPDQLTDEVPTPITTTGVQASIAINWEFEPNVFEYETGRVHLIAPAAVLLTSTPSGRDVFLDTYRQLAQQDTDGSPDVYDARANGGFPVLASPACSGTACQGAPEPAPIFSVPATTTFRGLGNFFSPPAVSPPKPHPRAVKCRKDRVRRRNRCVKRIRVTHVKKASAGRQGK